MYFILAPSKYLPQFHYFAVPVRGVRSEWRQVWIANLYIENKSTVRNQTLETWFTVTKKSDNRKMCVFEHQEDRSVPKLVFWAQNCQSDWSGLIVAAQILGAQNV